MNKEKKTIVSKDDLTITWFSGGGGGGGQHKNKHDNCCRITHKESGVTAQCTEHRSAAQNRTQAFKNLVEKPDFKLWLARKLLEIQTNETVEERVEKMMKPSNLKVEKIENGQWVEYVE